MGAAAVPRQILLLRAYNNTDSAPPLTITLTRPLTPIYRVAVSGLKASVSGGTAPYGNITATGLAGTGLSMAVDGTFSGTPTNLGNIYVTISCTDASATTISQTFVIRVVSRLSVTKFPRNLCEASVSYSPLSGISVTGNTGALSFTGSTHNGLTLSTAGVVSGSSPTAGNAFFTTTITDAGTGDTLVVSFSIFVASAWTPPSMTTIQIITDVPFSYTFNIPADYLPMALVSPPGSAPIGMAWTYSKGYSNPDGTVGIPASVTLSGVASSSNYKTAANFQMPSMSATDALGKSRSWTVPYVVINPAAIQPQQAGSGVGSGIANLNHNFVGPVVSNDGTTMTVDDTQAPGYTAALAGTWSTGNAYTATPSPAVAAYVTGQSFEVTFNAANTGSSTLNVSGLGAVSITLNGSALTANQITAGCTYTVQYTGSAFIIVSSPSSGGGTLTFQTLTTTQTISGNTDNFINANALTITLPASPTAGMKVSFMFANSITTFTFNTNSQKIETAAAGAYTHSATLANGGLRPFTLEFTNATDGWKFN